MVGWLGGTTGLHRVTEGSQTFATSSHKAQDAQFWETASILYYSKHELSNHKWLCAVCCTCAHMQMWSFLIPLNGFLLEILPKMKCTFFSLRKYEIDIRENVVFQRIRMINIRDVKNGKRLRLKTFCSRLDTNDPFKQRIWQNVKSQTVKLQFCILTRPQITPDHTLSNGSRQKIWKVLMAFAMKGGGVPRAINVF